MMKRLCAVLVCAAWVSGCVAFSPDRAVKDFMLLEPTRKYSTIRYDLDADGKNEYLLMFSTGKHSSRVKVIKFFGKTGTVIFEHVASTPNTQFRLFEGVPTLIFEESTYEPDYAAGARYKDYYAWDGSTFSFKERTE
ncbi:MAG: hypothetical protein PHT59_06830 [Candidatus Omnitrophica bacterium]|nr:hypothetical protein [Candidatus Omnitrophota bacterium]